MNGSPRAVMQCDLPGMRGVPGRAGKITANNQSKGGLKMPILYKRMNPQTLAYELFDNRPIDDAPQQVREYRRKEAEKAAADRLAEQLDADYVLTLLNKRTMEQIENTRQTITQAPAKPRITVGDVALVISEVGLIFFLTAFMIATLFI